MPRRTTRPPSVCSATGCSVEIQRGKLMCREHWFALPRPLRAAITSAWKERRLRDWSANCLEARAFLAGTTTKAKWETPRVTKFPLGTDPSHGEQHATVHNPEHTA